jgi:sugar lactone lactonase YvrE
MPSRALRFVVPAVVLVAAYLAFWPVSIEPVGWRAPAAPPAEGPYAPNDRLRGVEAIGAGVALGPEATAIDDRGRVHVGTSDGRILRLDPASRRFEELARTGGRPLGLAFDRAGRLYVCDAWKGLLALAPSGELTSVATSQGGVPLRFANDVDVGPDGTVYFTDASSRFHFGEDREDIVEHGGRGRLLAYHPASGRTDLLLGGLQFANGVAVSGDGTYLVVNETGAYRVVRYWLAGPKRGTAEPFLENLPGFPDNVTWSPEREAFWIALYAPRVPVVDALASRPALRKMILRLPRFTQPEPKRLAWALAVDESGLVVESLQDTSPSSYSPVTSVRERDGVLWIGSVTRDGLGRIAAPPTSRATRSP